MDPTFMPAGYSYHRAEYKSPPGPPADDIGYAYNAEKNAAIQDEWRYALRDLMHKAKAEGVVIPDQVSLTTDLDSGAFQGQYDSLLREGLRAYGHMLMPQGARSAPQLFYSAYGKETLDQLKRGGLPRYTGDVAPPQDAKFSAKKQPMMLVIGLVQDGKFLSKASGVYELPVYGFEEGVFAYVSGHLRPLRGAAYGELKP
jgi:hypothetical protein